jgi:ankyrin repeat protein
MSQISVREVLETWNCNARMLSESDVERWVKEFAAAKVRIFPRLQSFAQNCLRAPDLPRFVADRLPGLHAEEIDAAVLLMRYLVSLSDSSATPDASSPRAAAGVAAVSASSAAAGSPLPSTSASAPGSPAKPQPTSLSKSAAKSVSFAATSGAAGAAAPPPAVAQPPAIASLSMQCEAFCLRLGTPVADQQMLAAVAAFARRFAHEEQTFLLGVHYIRRSHEPAGLTVLQRAPFEKLGVAESGDDVVELVQQGMSSDQRQLLIVLGLLRQDRPVNAAEVAALMGTPETWVEQQLSGELHWLLRLFPGFEQARHPPPLLQSWARQRLNTLTGRCIFLASVHRAAVDCSSAAVLGYLSDTLGVSLAELRVPIAYPSSSDVAFPDPPSAVADPPDLENPEKELAEMRAEFNENARTCARCGKERNRLLTDAEFEALRLHRVDHLACHFDAEHFRPSSALLQRSLPTSLHIFPLMSAAEVFPAALPRPDLASRPQLLVIDVDVDVVLASLVDASRDASGFHYLVKRGFKSTTSSLKITTLHLAALRGCAEVVKELLKIGADVNAADQFDRTPLMLSVRGGHADVASALLAAGAKADAVGAGGQTALHVACAIGNRAAVDLLSASGAALNSADAQGRTPLMLACRHGHEAAALLLLQRSARQKSRDTVGNWGVLHHACAGGSVAIVRRLLEGGATVHTASGDGWTPLLIACRYGHTALVTLLLQRGAKPDQTHPSIGLGAVHFASLCGHDAVVSELLSFGLEVDSVDAKGRTALICACHAGRSSTVALLLTHNARSVIKDHSGLSALHYAANCGRVLSFTYLAERGMNANAETLTLVTAFMYALSAGATGLVAELRKRNVVKINRHSSVWQQILRCIAFSGSLALVAAIEPQAMEKTVLAEFACKYGRLSIARALIGKDVPLVGKHVTLAAASGSLALVRWLTEQRPQPVPANFFSGDELPLLAPFYHGLLGVVKAMTPWGFSKVYWGSFNALHYAACSDNVELVRHSILESLAEGKLKGALDTFVSPSPLMLAAACSNAPIVALLLQYGSNVHGESSRFDTALHYAAVTGSADVVTLLLDAGAAVDAVNHDLRTPLMLAAMGTHVAIAQLLIARGASLSGTDRFLRTPLHFAYMHGSEDMVRALLDAGADAGARDAFERTPAEGAALIGRKAVVSAAAPDASPASAAAALAQNAAAYAVILQKVPKELRDFVSQCDTDTPPTGALTRAVLRRRR